MNPTPPVAPNAVPPAVERMSGLAMTSLVLGICSLGCSLLAGIPALICGGMALARINRPGSRMLGRGQAVAGMILGGISFLLLPVVAILAALVVPAVATARGRADEVACMNNVRQIGAAVQMSALENTNRLPANVADLKPYLEDIDRISRCPARPGAGIAYEFTHETDRIDGAPDAIILKEVPGNHRGGRRTVLRADGTVEMTTD